VDDVTERAGSEGEAAAAAERDLRATSEDLTADAERLLEIEHEKSGLAPGDERWMALSDEAARISRSMVPKTLVERELAAEVTAANRE
jgi:hypothetical protein